MEIRSTTIEKYQKALKSLLGKLNQKDYTEYVMSKLIKEYNLFPGFGKILVDKGWIESRKGKGVRLEYRAKRSWKDVEPIHVKALIKACNAYNPKKTRQKQEVTVSTGVISVLDKLIKEASNLPPSTVKIVYRNKYNYTDVLESIQDAFKRGIMDLSNYEEHKITHSPRSIFISKITNGQTLSAADLKTAVDFAKMLADLNTDDSANGFKSRYKYHANKLAKTKSNLERVQLIDDMCMLFIKYRRTPGNRFQHFERYNQLLAESKN